ncbi:MAG: CBS domain-containing protein [Actinomycetota bacterium]
MEIGRLASKSLVTVGPRHSVAEAARRMTERKVGAAIVWMEDGRPGIITERDIMRALCERADLEGTPVSKYMTPNAVTGSPSEDALDAAHQMLEGGFRHLVVLDATGGPTGILSIRDLVSLLVQELESR